MCEVGKEPQRLVLVAGFLVDERADRDRQLQVRAGLAGPVRTFAVPAAFAGEFGMETVVDQRVRMRAGDDVHRPAVAAVAAARPAARHPHLAAERQAAAAAVAGFDVNVDFVNEHTG